MPWNRISWTAMRFKRLSFDRSDSISITSKTRDRGLVTQWVQSKVADVRSEVAEIKVADVRAKVADV